MFRKGHQLFAVGVSGCRMCRAFTYEILFNNKFVCIKNNNNIAWWEPWAHLDRPLTVGCYVVIYLLLFIYE